MSEEDQPKCPVDHTARSAWTNNLKDIPEGHPPIESSQTSSQQPSCPVDHSARSEWLNKVSISAGNVPDAIEVPSSSHSSPEGYVTPTTAVSGLKVDLPTEREISSIPRTSSDSNWIYPSQKQFFEAMHRKSWNPEAQDMKTVVPIHNAVNERAWNHILNWERSHSEEAIKKCGGITLTSFKGDSKKLTPRAWFNSTFLGYQKPFDRHDWIVNRCGTEVEYVIDFYSGSGQGASFFLDVRPKVNTWEGVKLRFGRALGWS